MVRKKQVKSGSKESYALFLEELRVLFEKYQATLCFDNKTKSFKVTIIGDKETVGYIGYNGKFSNEYLED